MIHVASAVDADRKQHCSRCGVVLKDLSDPPRWSGRIDDDIPTSGGAPYPVGTKVEKHESWQAMVIGPSEPDCEP